MKKKNDIKMRNVLNLKPDHVSFQQYQIQKGLTSPLFFFLIYLSTRTNR